MNLDHIIHKKSLKLRKGKIEYFSLNSIAYEYWKGKWTMPRAKTKKDKKNGDTTEKQFTDKWINVRFDNDQTEDVIELISNPDAILANLATYFNNGFDLSVSYKESKGNYSCYLSGSFVPDHDTRYKIASYARTSLEAIGVGLYKLQLFTENPPSYITESQGLAFG